MFCDELHGPIMVICAPRPATYITVLCKEFRSNLNPMLQCTHHNHESALALGDTNLKKHERGKPKSVNEQNIYVWYDSVMLRDS